MTDYADAITRWAAGFVLAATALIAIVININAGLMQDFGGDGTIVSAGYLLAALGVIAIAGEIASPVFIRKSWIAGTIILAFSIAITGLNELGFYSQARSAHAENIGTIASTRQRLATEVGELTKRLWAVRTKPAGELRAEMDEILAKRVKTRSGYTTIAKATRDCAPQSYLTARFCKKVFELKKALAVANNIASLERGRDRAQAALNRLKAAGHANALSATLAGVLAPFLKIKTADVENFVRLMFVVSVHGLLLASSSLLFGPARRQRSQSSSGDTNDRPNHKRKGSRPTLVYSAGTKVHPEGAEQSAVRTFLNLHIEPSKGSAIGATELFEAYMAEQKPPQCPIISQRRFGELMAVLGHTDKKRCGKTGRVQYCALAWKTEGTAILAA